MILSEMIQAREERKFMKELRKLKKMELIEEYERSDSRSIVDNKAVVNITSLSLVFSLILAFIDIKVGMIAGASTIAVIVVAIFIEALIQSIFEAISDFIHMNFTADRERRRSYKQTKKVIKYAIKNDKLSDEQISLMIEGLVLNARDEQKRSSFSTIDFSRVFSDKNNTTDTDESVNENEIDTAEIKAGPITEVKQTKAGKYSLVFNDTDISIMNGSQEIERVSYNEIQQATTQEEIASMPYSTIYGYVVKEDKTIYIDMEKEVAIIK